MQQNSKDLTYIIGTSETVKQMRTVPSFVPFDERVVMFLNTISGKLLKSGKGYSDVITFAF